jgi:membrane protease YdiL (CAAX protease family)
VETTNTPALRISNRTRVLEIAAVLLTGMGKFVFVDGLGAKLPFIVAAILGWGAYVYLRHHRQPGILAYWGFRTDSFRRSFLQLLPLATAAVLLFAGVGYATGKWVLSWHLLPVLLLYPVWGVIQQFLVVGLVAGNLHDYAGRRLPPVAVTGSTAVLFSAVHWRARLLVAGTFVLAVVYVVVYLRRRNLWALGLYHGWLGGFFYFLVLGRDPWQEVFAAGTRFNIF